MKKEDLEVLVQSMGRQLNALYNLLAVKKRSKFSFYEWLDEWYLLYKVKAVPPLSENGLYQIKNCIEKHIKQNVSNLPLSDLTPLLLQNGLNSIDSSRMRKYTFDTLNDCLRQAYILDELPANLMDKVPKVKHTRAKILPLTKKMEKTFLTALYGNRLADLYRFYLLTGVRKMEAVAIKWTDIQNDKNRLFIPGTKTVSSKRYIPLFDNLKELLHTIPREKEYIFPYSESAIESNFRRLKEKNGFTFGIHALRHTFATRMYEVGISDKVIAKWLGHSRVSTTQNIYIDVLDRFEQDEIKKVNAFYKDFE